MGLLSLRYRRTKMEMTPGLRFRDLPPGTLVLLSCAIPDCPVLWLYHTVAGDTPRLDDTRILALSDGWTEEEDLGLCCPRHQKKEGS